MSTSEVAGDSLVSTAQTTVPLDRRSVGRHLQPVVGMETGSRHADQRIGRGSPDIRDGTDDETAGSAATGSRKGRARGVLAESIGGAHISGWAAGRVRQDKRESILGHADYQLDIV